MRRRVCSMLSQVDGKLGCPKCSARIGSYNWSGMQCSCGAWVAPAIQVVKSKVDEVQLDQPRPSAQPTRRGPAAGARPLVGARPRVVGRAG